MKKYHLLIIIFFCLGMGTGMAQYKDLLDFYGEAYPYGEEPYCTLALSGNTVYGTTSIGGLYNYGNVFSMNINGSSYTDLFDFQDTNGKYPECSLTVSGNMIYGTYETGVFLMHTNGSGYKYFNVTAGQGGVVLLGNKLYGLSTLLSTIYCIDTNGNNYRTLRYFNGGAYPYGTLTVSGGILYGTASGAGAYGYGYIFCIDTDGTKYRDLFDFNNSTGASPYCDLLLDGYKLYGTTHSGGPFNRGVIFSMDTNGGAYTDLHDFSGSDGQNPCYGSLKLVGSKLYGMTEGGGLIGYGTIFSIDTNGATFTKLWTFHNYLDSNGTNPYASLIYTNEAFYGTTTYGGYGGMGNIFRFRDTTFNLAIATTEYDCNHPGSALATPLGGKQPYTYLWSPGGQTTDSITGLSPGSYSITVHDSNGHSLTAVAVITQPATLNAAIIVKNILCNGEMGSLSLYLNGGLSPYTYLWSNGGTAATETGLSVGTYSVNVMDVCGNTATATATITQPNALIVSATISAKVLCLGDGDGSITANVTGGTSPYSYLWNNNATTTAISNLYAGNYTVKIQDSNGCAASASITLTQPAFMGVSTTVTNNELCNGGNNGTISSSITGGSSPYTYLWSNGQTTANLDSLSAGSYTLGVTDANGCSTSSSTTITQPTALSIVADDYGFADTGCHGVAYVTAFGGTSPYNYTWNNGATTDTIKNLCDGLYCCVITDRNGCIDSACIDNTTAVNSISNTSGGISVYPNPSGGTFVFQLSVASSKPTLEVYDLLGQRIFVEALKQVQGNNTINLSTQPNGIYLYRVIMENGALLGEGKLVIQK